MITRNQIEELYPDSTMLFADGFDEAILGVDENMFGMNNVRAITNNEHTTERVVYSVKKMIQVLKRDLPEDEIMEYLEHNTFAAYVGINTPVYCHDED